MSAGKPGGALLALMLILTACQSERPYPDLSTVPPLQDNSAPLEERRQIVRDLIENRGFARQRQTTVRHRSGLDDVQQPTASTTSRAEDIVREAPIELDEQAEEVLESDSERAYRDRAQFDDGTLNDFIRRLKRDTAPVVDTPIPDDQSSSSSPPPKPQSWHFETAPLVTFASAVGHRKASDQPIYLAAFAPAIFQNEGPVTVQFVADESDPGFFCSYLGWMVAWSNACLDDEGESGDVTAEVDGGDANNQEKTTDTQEQTPSEKKTESPEDKVADQGSEDVEDAAGPSEDLDSSGATPVAGVLDRLRNLIRSRTRNTESSSRAPDSLAYEADELKSPEDLGPPLPRRRPKVEKDLTIVRNDRVFEFKRTPRPAFKPIPPEPKTVIFPPKKPRTKERTKFVPAARPELVIARNDAVQSSSDQADESAGQPSSDINVAANTSSDRADTDQATTTDEPASAKETEQVAKADPSEQTASTPTTEASVQPEDHHLIDSDVIEFKPGSAELPIGTESRLGSMLRRAKSKQGKIFIISEAGIGSLAMERARGVGLALVRMGATADLIEYDIGVEKDVDRVTLHLRHSGDGDK